MKKKLAGLLVAAMVLSMGTSVFAAKSPGAGTTLEEQAQQLRDTVSSVDSSEDGVSVKCDVVDTDNISDANKEATGYSEDAEVLGAVELKSDADFSKGVTLTFYVSGVQKGDNIRILHKLPSGKWEVIVPYVGNGYIRATFYSLSPIAIVKYPKSVKVPSSQEVNPADEEDTEKESESQNININVDVDVDVDVDNDNNNNNDNRNDNKNDNKNDNSNKNNTGGTSNGNSGGSAGSNAKTSPKTGQSVPALPILAVFALSGAIALVGRKAKNL